MQIDRDMNKQTQTQRKFKKDLKICIQKRKKNIKKREREQKLASTIWDKVLQGQPTIGSLPLETKEKTLKKYFPSEKNKNRKAEKNTLLIIQKSL